MIMASVMKELKVSHQWIIRYYIKDQLDHPSFLRLSCWKNELPNHACFGCCFSIYILPLCCVTLCHKLVCWFSLSAPNWSYWRRGRGLMTPMDLLGKVFGWRYDKSCEVKLINETAHGSWTFAYLLLVCFYISLYFRLKIWLYVFTTAK